MILMPLSLIHILTARSIAEQKKTSFGVPGKEILLNGLTGNNSEPFLDLWMGEEAKPEDFTRVYEEKEERIYTGACRHDLEHGCYVAGEDRGVFNVEDGTLLMGNLQAESYFAPNREQPKMPPTKGKSYLNSTGAARKI